MKIFSDKPFSKTSFGQSKWFKTPSKTNLAVVTLVWLIGVTIIVLAKTEIFQKTFLDISYLFTYFIILFSLLIVVNVYRNYFKNNQG
ncbi:hypothetical protein [Ferruginibacter sp.]|nr:hypothetical protein [Ferruginibacter sp.]